METGKFADKAGNDLPAGAEEKMNWRKQAYCGEDSGQYQARETAAKRLQSAMERQSQDMEALLWEALILFQSCSFQTAKGLEFTYTVKGNEIFFSRKEKSITRATVNRALDRVLELGGIVTGPKKLGCFGASYLYPVFQKMSVIQNQPSDI